MTNLTEQLTAMLKFSERAWANDRRANVATSADCMAALVRVAMAMPALIEQLEAIHGFHTENVKDLATAVAALAALSNSMEEK